MTRRLQDLRQDWLAPTPDTLPYHGRSGSALSDPELARLLANPSGPTLKPFCPHRSERSESKASSPQGQRCEAEEGGWR